MKPLFFFILIISLSAFAQDPGSFPKDGGVVDVRDYGARADDRRDDTAAIQKALDSFPNGNRIVYLPAGTWIVTDTLRWPKGEGGNGEKRTILQGAGISRTSLVVPPSTPAFGGKPRAVLWTGEKPAQRFRNAVRDLTIEIGRGNPQAIGMQFNASNQGTIRNVVLRAAQDSGHIGLDMGFTDEIGPLLVRRLMVEGFETGISTKWPVNSNTFENITLRGQRRLGWHNYHQMIFVRNLRSENAVTTLYNEKDSMGTVTLLDAMITGQARGTPGILNERWMYLRNVEVRGLGGIAVDHADKGRDKGDVTEPGVISEDTSHAEVHALFRDVPDHTFATAGVVRHLPVKETPEVPWAGKWVNLEAFGAAADGTMDASEALQKAIDSGADTIYLPAGKEFFFDSEVLIRGSVRRIMGLEGRFFSKGEAVWRLVDGGQDAPVVMIERMSNRSGGHNIELRHESKRTLIVSSATGFHVEGRGSGDIFVDDLCGRLDLTKPGQSAWCRQLNIEHEGVMCRNNGGRLWILGMKTEKIGTIIETLNGGITDVSGVFIYANQGWEPGVPAFICHESTLTLCGVNDRNYTQRPIVTWVRETQDGETRHLDHRPWVYLSR